MKIRGFHNLFEMLKTRSYGLQTALRLFFKSRYLFSGLNKLRNITFKVIHKLVKALKLSNFSSTEDLQKSLVFKAKVMKMNISSNPLKTIDYLNSAQISLKTFNKAVDTPVRIYIIRPTAKEARQ